MQFLMRWLYRLYPAFCCACKAVLSVRTTFCDACALTIKAHVSTEIEVTAVYTMRVFCVGAYQEPLKKLVLAKSYADHLACYYMARLIYERSLFSRLEADYIIPIPLHWQRYAKRGYNQAEEIARYLSRWSGIPIKRALRRNRATEFQSLCNKSGRFENLKGVFDCTLDAADRAAMQGKKLLFIDDVMTTGATLASAGKALAVVKPSHMFACVLAR